MKKTVYTIKNDSFIKKSRFALVSDLHSGEPSRVISMLKEIEPDYILLAGDILEALDGSCDEKNENAFCVFKQCADIAPTFYCTGNHEDGGVHSQSKKWKNAAGKEREYSEQNVKRIRESGVVFLLNESVIHDGIAFGGLASGLICKNGEPDLEFLSKFSKIESPKVLICHHPEYYEKYIKDLSIDIIVSGHAHGGQWRVFGRGVYAPGQGLFPKYTSGVFDGRLVVSKGLKKSWPIPRIFNPTEIVIIEV
jgi:predicted MPP superfamily phosphohydrolase